MFFSEVTGPLLPASARHTCPLASDQIGERKVLDQWIGKLDVMEFLPCSSFGASSERGCVQPQLRYHSSTRVLLDPFTVSHQASFFSVQPHSF